LLLVVGQNFVDSEDFITPIKTKFDESVVPPIDLKTTKAFKSTLGNI
jgi:hypothetical protein